MAGQTSNVDTGSLPANIRNLPKNSAQIPVFIPAAVADANGTVTPSAVPVTQAGTVFYVITSSVGNLKIQPIRAGNVGIENTFGVGQGQTVKDGFETLQVRNFNTFSVVAIIWVGFNDFINDQLILAQQQYPTVVYPTYTQPVTSPASTVDIVDLSGTKIVDINGIAWLALYRIEIEMSNLDAANVYTLQKTGATTNNDPAIVAIQPTQTITRPLAGNYRVRSGATINMLIVELYACVKPVGS
jgi:hypothetical protein